MTIKIVTNNKPRLLIDAYQLTEKEREEFDYLDWKVITSGDDDATFFRYKGQLYDLGDFMLCPSDFQFEGWTGYYSDSAFSGILIKLCDNNDYIIVGRYYC